MALCRELAVDSLEVDSPAELHSLAELHSPAGLDSPAGVIGQVGHQRRWVERLRLVPEVADPTGWVLARPGTSGVCYGDLVVREKVFDARVEVVVAADELQSS